MPHHQPPDLMPVLSRGKHRSPRKGACFMELASYLAGERWSDHPSCTHPLLAALARDVNDHVGDAHRTWLAPLVPQVIALTTDDRRADGWIAREAALAALPVVAAEKQGVAAVGVLRCEWYLAHLEGRPEDEISDRSRAALEAVPHARVWAHRFAGKAPTPGPGSADKFRRRSAPMIVHTSVAGIATASVAQRERLLVDLLERTIAGCRTWFGHGDAAVPHQRWSEAVALTRR